MCWAQSNSVICKCLPLYKIEFDGFLSVCCQALEPNSTDLQSVPGRGKMAVCDPSRQLGDTKRKPAFGCALMGAPTVRARQDQSSIFENI
jgi:hypothetical protein